MIFGSICTIRVAGLYNPIHAQSSFRYYHVLTVLSVSCFDVSSFIPDAHSRHDLTALPFHKPEADDFSVSDIVSERRLEVEEIVYQNAPRPSEHPPVMGKKMSKRLVVARVA